MLQTTATRECGALQRARAGGQPKRTEEEREREKARENQSADKGRAKERESALALCGGLCAAAVRGCGAVFKREGGGKREGRRERVRG